MTTQKKLRSYSLVALALLIAEYLFFNVLYNLFLGTGLPYVLVHCLPFLYAFELLLITVLVENKRILALFGCGLFFAAMLIEWFTIRSSIFYALAALCLFVYTLLFPKESGQKLKRFWFVPAILYIIGFVFRTISNLQFSNTLSVLYYINNLLITIVLLFFAKWLAGEPQDDAKAAPWNETVSMAMHIVLLLLTTGIYYWFWIYQTTAYYNKGDTKKAETELLLCMLVPFYAIYWMYRTAKNTDMLGAERNVPSNITTLCLVLAIFVPIVTPIVIQSKIATILDPAASQPRNNPVIESVPEELKKYKELLDAGAITQEEFDAKKKQLLGL